MDRQDGVEGQFRAVSFVGDNVSVGGADLADLFAALSVAAAAAAAGRMDLREIAPATTEAGTAERESKLQSPKRQKLQILMYIRNAGIQNQRFNPPPLWI